MVKKISQEKPFKVYKNRTKTDTGGLVSSTKVYKRMILKELGKLTL